MKLHVLLIGVIFIGLMTTGILNFISAGVNSMEDSSSSGFEESTLASFDRNAQLAAKYEEALNNETASSSEQATGDILGSLFGRGYQQVRGEGITSNLDMYSNIVTDGVDEITILGTFGVNVRVAIIGAISVAILVGLLMYFIIGKERV